MTTDKLKTEEIFLPDDDILKLKRLFIPRNINNSHWTLVVVNVEIKQIRYNDPTGQTNQEKLKDLFWDLKDKHTTLYKTEVDGSG